MRQLEKLAVWGFAAAIVGTDFIPLALSNNYLKSFIPSSCCVTNDCCWEVSAREVQPMPMDQWRIVASGQVLKRTDWSPDGKYYRCACDNIEGKWVVHPTAKTRCIFVPPQGS